MTKDRKITKDRKLQKKKKLQKTKIVFVNEKSENNLHTCFRN